MAKVQLMLLPLVALGLLTMAVLCTARVGETITAKIQHSSHRRQKDECSSHEQLYGQIFQDLMPWALKGIRLQNLIYSHKLCSESPGMYICVLIENGQVFLSTLHDRRGGGHVKIQAGFLLELYELSQRYKLPDVEFALYTGDQSQRNMNTSVLGSDHILLAYNKRWEAPDVTPEILIPFSAHFRCFSNAFDSMEAVVKNFSHAAIPWESRKQVAITRFTVFCPALRGKFLSGQARPCARVVLPLVSAASNGTLDLNDTLKAGSFLSMVQHAQHRYLVSTDGWTASSKLEKYLLMGSTVLKQASPLVAYYYAALTPWVHYVPFYQYHQADILEAVAWLRANDAQAKAIAQNAYRFARLHLARPARLCYYRELFARMAPLYRYRPSCKDRPMCVPLLEELKYMGWFTGSDCDVHRQLDQIHGKDIDKGAAPRQPYGSDKFFHGFSNYTLFKEPYTAHLGLNAARR